MAHPRTRNGPDPALGAALGLLLCLIALSAVQIVRYERAAGEVREVEALSAEIMRLDAVLTLSATLGAATGEASWRARYDAAVPELDAALDRAVRLGGARAAAYVDAVAQSNERLIVMETRAFALSAAHRDEALGLMLSQAYARDKQIYSAGVADALRTTRTHAESVRDQMWGSLLALGVGAAAATAAFFWRRRKLRLERREARLQESLASAEAARAELEATVADRTQALSRALAQAQSSELAKSRFLANMSHEIRTPLNGVVGLSAALADSPLGPRQREMAELIRQSGETLDRIVSEILDLSKIEAGKLALCAEPFRLDAAIEGPAELMRLRAEEKGLAFSVAVDPSADGWFLGDAVRIRQIASNLISNAVKFTERGKVAVEASADADGFARIVVADTGIGFDAATKARLFSRFEQADGSIARRFGGTGLGLSICKALADLMGGTIDVVSSPGAGARFTVRLPLPRAAAPAAASESGPAPFPRSLRVLLAEDNAVNRRVAALLLEPWGAELTLAEDGKEAIAAYRAGRFDLVLMDMMMPEVDGVAATRAIRAFEAQQRRAPTPIVMLSANAMPEHEAEALAAGCDLHLPKPVTPRSLALALERVATPARRAG